MRVLVIDDEPDVLLLCRVNLEFEGIDVSEAGDGERGIEIAREERPDLIILDIMMPRMDGFSVLEELKRHPETEDIPVIMLTAKAQENDQIRGWMAGVADYVTKPFSPTALTEAVSRVSAMSQDELHARRRETLSLLSVLDEP